MAKTRGTHGRKLMEENMQNTIERIRGLIMQLNQKKVRLQEVSNKDLESLLQLCADNVINIPESNIQSVRNELKKRKERSEAVKPKEEKSVLLEDQEKVSETESEEESMSEDLQKIWDNLDLPEELPDKQPVEELPLERAERKPEELFQQTPAQQMQPEEKKKDAPRESEMIPVEEKTAEKENVKEDEQAKKTETVIEDAEREARMQKLEFENSLLKISSLNEEPKKEDYDFSDEEWNRIHDAWLKKHPQKKEPERNLVIPEDNEEDESSGLGWLKWFIIILLLALLAVGGFIGWRRYDASRKAKSLDELRSKLLFESNPDIEVPVIEAGDALTYSDNSVAELQNIPDQLKNYFISVPEGALIEISQIDTGSCGLQDVTITMSKADQYGQTAVNSQGFTISIQDTKQPEVRLNASSIEIEGADETAIRANVQAVIDPVFGEYAYSSSRENRTYSIDTGAVNFEESGTYPAAVVIQDNGNEYRQEFEVTVKAKPKESSSGNTASKPNRPAGPVYTYVDQYGNLYTDQQAQELAASESNVELHSYEDFVETYDAEGNNKGDYSSAQAACYATSGTWDGRNCNY